jgi:hypothetical protein
MRSRTTSRFWKLFAALPEAVRQQAYKAYEQFTSDPFYPSLSFKEVNPRVGLWSARINDDYRVLGYREGDEIKWFWVGKHDEYTKLIRRS